MNRSRISRIFLAAVAGAFAAGTAHVVVKGDTLWDITGKYLGNPFQWPLVWQKNPQIKNAHWIYPGDTVDIDGAGKANGQASGSGATVGADTGAGAAAVVSNDPLAEFKQNPDNVKQVVVDTVAAALDLIIPPSQSVLNLEMVVDAPVLYPPDDEAPKLQSELIYDKDYGQHQLMPGFVIEGRIGSDDGLKLGDRMMIIERDDRVATNVLAGTKGRLEETRALADIVEIRKKTILCRLVAVYGPIASTAKIRRFVMPTAAKVTAFEDFQETEPAKVLINDRLGRIQMPGTSVIINRGEAEGIGQGDIYEFMENGADRGMVAMRGYGMVVRTTRTTATIMIVGCTPKAINVGDKAWRLRRSVRS